MQNPIQPPVSRMRPAPPSEEPAGNFTPEDIAQIAQDTGYSPEQVQQDIARTDAQTKEELYPNVYQGTGIQPETMGSGVVQGQPPPPPGEAPPPAPPMPGAAPEAMEGGPGQIANAAPGEGSEGLPPEALEAMHTAMAPSPRPMRRAAQAAPPPPSGPAWRRHAKAAEVSGR